MKVRAVLAGRSTVICVFGLHGAIQIFFLLTSFSLPFSELSLVGLALVMVDKPSSFSAVPRTLEGA